MAMGCTTWPAMSGNGLATGTSIATRTRSSNPVVVLRSIHASSRRRKATIRKSIGEWDNTLIMFISDNGASAEGGPHGSVNENKFFNNVSDSLEENLRVIDQIGGPMTFNHYPWGWTFAGNTPFRRWKRVTYRGGISDPFIVHWPKGIKAKGEVRTQYAHAIDMVPTVLEALGIEPPTSIKGVTQSLIEGHSFAHTFDNAHAPTKHITQRPTGGRSPRRRRRASGARDSRGVPR